MTFYSATFMGSKFHNRGSMNENEFDVQRENDCVSPDVKPKIFEKNYKQFPARRVMRQQTKFEFLRQPTMLPKVETDRQPTMSSSSDSQIATLRAKLAHRQQINGPIQLDHYTSPRPDLAPLYGPASIERLERGDTCFSTSRLVLGKRSKTQLTLNTTRSAAVEGGRPEPFTLPHSITSFPAATD
ncbi:hypothetical protein MAR_019372 [Mya arenaria]|uniref:Uncharacterized protein n=1 Tax=Mya arenaria TaxID=6604 RepID=A0ABY7EK74_MYAAR|nr:hypothetical protein MAR_019372 [Mya arenaria]